MDILVVWFIYGLQALVLLVVVQLVVTHLIRWAQARRRNPERVLAEVKHLVDVQIATGLGYPLLEALDESPAALAQAAGRLTAEQRTLVTMWLFRPETKVSLADCNTIIGAFQNAEAEATASATTTP
ncbi:MAG: hypothetical protein H0X24_01660 [Ktedonobacterales bacterium]|nr:hypothetical protein [Ktedonobacterales bacterium]